MSSEKYSNDAVSTLNGAINNSTTTVVVNSAAAFPATGQFRIRIDDEFILVTSVSSNTFTVLRGREGSAAASHLNLAPVTHVMTKGAFDQIYADNVQLGACASRPSAEREGRLYYGSDYPLMFRDNGSSWDTFYKAQKILPPVTAGYTWAHGGGTATNTDVTNGPSLLSVVSTGASDRVSTFFKTRTAPYAITVRVGAMLNIATSYCGIAVGDGTKFTGLGFIYESGVIRVWTPKFTNKTAYGSEYFRFDPGIDYGDTWLRMTDDNTNLIYALSHDGYHFFDIFSVTRTDFLTPTQGGVWIGTNAATSSPAKMLWMSDN